MSHSFQFRPGTQDEAVFNEVVTHNSYRLPNKLPHNAVVVDIGANVGTFCHAALIRGARKVYAFEAMESNYLQARENLRSYGDKVELHHAAVWRSDREVEFLNVSTLSEEATGCNTVFDDRHGKLVKAASLDSILARITRNGKRPIDLLKIDCEGSEFPILLTSRKLHWIREIVGEFHNFDSGVGPGHPFFNIPEVARVEGFDRFTDMELCKFLADQGFEISVTRHAVIPHLLGEFRAVLSRVPQQQSISFWGLLQHKLGLRASA